MNYAFRLGVSRGIKLRARDDLKHPLTNLSCAVRTPIKLSSWGHLAEICRRVAPASQDWRFSKADHESAYKQLPLQGDHSCLAEATIRNPDDGLRYGFRSRTILFGAAAAVLRYNAFSRIVAEIFARLSAFPC